MKTRSGTVCQIFNNTSKNTYKFDFLKKKREKDKEENKKSKQKINEKIKVKKEIENKIQLDSGSKIRKLKKNCSEKRAEILNTNLLELSKNDSKQEIFNDSYVDSLMIRTEKDQPGTGLKNLGNTCFLNSVLQCILYTIPLKNYFTMSNHSETCNSKNVCFICEYGRLSSMIRKNFFT